MSQKEKTFADFDKFGLEAFADKLTQFLLVESKFVEGSFVLSLNSEFGSGKTTFFEMWANKLHALSDAPEVVYLNARESDFQGDPLLAVVSALLERLEPKEAGKDIESVKETAGKLCRFGLSLGNDVIQKLMGPDLIRAVEFAKRKAGDTEAEIGHACFQLYRERQKLFTRLRSLLGDLARVSESPILVFVAELDRCRPNYAIEFLETVKHFFDIQGLVFVLGVDKKQLAASAKALFGQQLDFDEYYRKFAHRNVTLPVKSSGMTERFCTALVDEYLGEEAFEKRKRFPFIKQDSARTRDIVELCAAFSLNARQIHELFRTAAHMFSATQKADSHLLWGWHVGAFFMVALSLKDEEFYHRIGRKDISLQEFTAYLKKLWSWTDRRRHGFWWAALLYLGAFGENPLSKLEKEFKELGVWDPSGRDEGAFQQELSGCAQGYGRWGDDSAKVFSRIYEILEGLRTFADR